MFNFFVPHCWNYHIATTRQSSLRVSIFRKTTLCLWNVYFSRSVMCSLVAISVLSWLGSMTLLFQQVFPDTSRVLGKSTQQWTRSWWGGGGKGRGSMWGGHSVEDPIGVWNTLWVLIETMQCCKSQIIYILTVECEDKYRIFA